MIIFNRTLRDGLPLPDTLIHGVPGTAIMGICAMPGRRETGHEIVYPIPQTGSGTLPEFFI